jgi:hypothetical protein
VGELFKNRLPSTLTLGDALSTGFGLVIRPTFIVPVLIIGVIVNSIVRALFGPLITDGVAPTGIQVAAQIQGMIGNLLVGAIIAIIGGILVNLYGQVWAIEASSGPFPTVNKVVSLSTRRWVGIIGTGIVVAVITIALLVALVVLAGIAFAAVGNFGWLVVLIAFVGFAYITARLSMAGWLAADGASVQLSIVGSWQITQGSTLRIIGWGLAYGIVFAIVSGIAGAILGLVPVIGDGIAQSIGIALGYGGGVTLFRRTQAAATPPPARAEAIPSVAT